jgi:chemotaxis family two-component system response regulator Rcp1
MTPTAPIQILLAEDSVTDAELTREAFLGAHVANEIHHVLDGDEAVQFVRRAGRFAHAPRPDLILLDLNLPRRDGREVLAEIKADPDLRRIPVIVLTTSDAPQDITAAYNQHVNAYIKKPVDLEQFIHAIRSIEEFWLVVVRLPQRQTETSPTT